MEDTFKRLYESVGAIQTTVELLPDLFILKEECRKVSRLARRVEVLVKDIQPYVNAMAPNFKAVLLEIDGHMLSMVELINAISAKGPLASFMQADRTLTSFLSEFASMASTLDNIQGRLPQETNEELASVKALLQRARFDLSPDHASVMLQYRSGVAAMSEAHTTLMGACDSMLRHMNEGDPQLTKEVFERCLSELLFEHQLVLRGGDPQGDCVPLRTMMDVLRQQQRTHEVPLAFICPLTHQVMQDPVVLVETGHSYERKALKHWWTKGHRMCPKTGTPLNLFRLKFVSNDNLKQAIEDWRMFGALAVPWKTLLAQPTPTQSPLKSLHAGRVVAGTHLSPAKRVPSVSTQPAPVTLQALSTPFNLAVPPQAVPPTPGSGHVSLAGSLDASTGERVSDSSGQSSAHSVYSQGPQAPTAPASDHLPVAMPSGPLEATPTEGDDLFAGLNANENGTTPRAPVQHDDTPLGHTPLGEVQHAGVQQEVEAQQRDGVMPGAAQQEDAQRGDSQPWDVHQGQGGQWDLQQQGSGKHSHLPPTDGSGDLQPGGMQEGGLPGNDLQQEGKQGRVAAGSEPGLHGTVSHADDDEDGISFLSLAGESRAPAPALAPRTVSRSSDDWRL